MSVPEMPPLPSITSLRELQRALLTGLSSGADEIIYMLHGPGGRHALFRFTPVEARQALTVIAQAIAEQQGTREKN